MRWPPERNVSVPRIGIVIPALNEGQSLPLLLADLAPLGASVEIIVSDGGSTDDTARIAEACGARVVHSLRGRALQLRAGAALCSAPVLVFLHADSRLPAETLRRLTALRPADGWGFFRPQLAGRSRCLPLVSWCMAWRSRLSGIATGDQGLYLSRALHDRIGGFPEQPLMEDIEICARLRRVAAPQALAERVVSSGRRWDRDGAVRTILLMWWLRLRYRFGADPAVLHRAYYGL